MPETSLQGVLFLTAGYGTRAEPLSFARPKCLLPWRESTVLGNLVRQFALLEPEMMAFNASRCPELVLEEAGRFWGGEKKLLFEHRPLGTPGTLARNRDLFQGTWVLCNTDFAMEVPVTEIVAQHNENGSRWTVLTCGFPAYGSYRPLRVGNRNMHYAGVSVIAPEVAEAASGEQLAGGLFTSLRETFESGGNAVEEHFSPGEWLDMGETEHFRRNTLAQGSFVHRSATVEKGASLEGFYSVGPYCIIHHGAVVRNSVLLAGAEALNGQRAEETVVPWFCKGVPID